MADYYPLIARAVDGLSDRSAAMRQVVYERARTALLTQLRSMDPPVDEADIERERISLDDAIARVEARDEPAAAEPPAPVPIGLPETAPEPERPPDAEPGSPPAAEAAEEAGSPGPAEKPPGAVEPAGPVRPRVESRSPQIRTAGRGRAVVLGSVLAVVIGVIAYFAWLWQDRPNLDGAAVPAAAVQPRSDDGAKFAERVGGGPAAPAPEPAPAPGPARSEVGVAQRAVLYEEDPANPRAPKATAGRVTWRIDGVNAGQGQPLETAVRAQVEVPEAGLTMTLLIRRNLDNTLPASHTAEIAFVTRPGESGRAIRDVGLLQFKDDFSTRGTPLAGQRITLGENLFVIGLPSTDVQRNAELMKRGWVDLPLLMASGQRAVLTFEKGGPGDQAMAEAWRQWQ
jgi:hypothetical protein